MRNSMLDSAKGALIFLVVLGHFLERLIGWQEASSFGVLAVVYAVHMPAFIFISGMLFKQQAWQKNLRFLMALFLIFHVAYLGLSVGLGGQWRWNWFERPYWLLWYLLGMMAWVVLTVCVARFKYSLLLAVVVSLWVGLSVWNNYQYSIGRILVFWPFFMAGHLYGNQWLECGLKKIPHQWILGVGLLCVVALWVQVTELSPYWLYGSWSYEQLSTSYGMGLLRRLACLLMGSLGIVALGVLVTYWMPWLSALGRSSLSVYLLHGLVVMVVARFVSLELMWWLELLVVLGLSVVTCWVLQPAWIDKLIRQAVAQILRPVEYCIERCLR